ncbi:hypothetical protein SAMN05216353_10712 [Halobacillus alkaliphilus]|uniref:Uncharacterized protein n=1 Tax=Halobacillus alkaliphilus TaxID=396056 RepID=A0A1I2L5Q0_9BACI|nr:hypothetical protein [Halobacillus alkaliphilus]SFF72581.1 hypothetical protein SAMN05216353_10712 [Halobacillus alkaliphilus]
MHIKNICKKRKIKKTNMNSPLIVPSFSSKGFTDVSKIHTYVRDYITDACLVSAYDLYHDQDEQIPLADSDIYISDVLFIDSGGYERDQDTELSEIYNKEYKPKKWNEDLHLKVVNQLEELTKIVIVNYDSEIRKPTKDQMSQAENLFNKFPNFTSDFLYKPEMQEAEYIDANKLIYHLDDITSFSILGLTEKELGSSILKKCETIYSIRRALNAKEIDIPIHIFGCIDPANILAYFLCGADIFDGLSWLRFNFNESGDASYRNSHAIINGNWDLKMSAVRGKALGDNIKILINLSSQMNRFLNTYDWQMFDYPEKLMNEIKKLISTVGIDYS